MKVILTEGFQEDCERLGLSKSRGWSVRKIYWRLIPYDLRPGQIWYRLKCRFWHRYTTVHPRTLPWHTWTDRDDLLLHCCFEILTKFMEKEFDWQEENFEQHPKRAAAMRRLKELHRWWTTDFKDMDPHDLDYHQQVKKRLYQLVSVYDCMWT